MTSSLISESSVSNLLTVLITWKFCLEQLGQATIFTPLDLSFKDFNISQPTLTSSIGSEASDPIDEVKVGWEMLKSLKLRSRGVKIVACPSCSRQNFQVIKTVNKLETELSEIKEEVTLAVIGCYVNGPGESKVADVGVTGASPQHLIYLKGKPAYKVDTEDLEKSLVKEVMKIAEQKSNTILKQ